MNTLRFYAALALFLTLFQTALAQEPAVPGNMPKLEVTANCQEGDALCALTERVNRLESANNTNNGTNNFDPHCMWFNGQYGCWGVWPPDCGWGYIRMGMWCVPIIVEPTNMGPMASSNSAEPMTPWPSR